MNFTALQDAKTGKEIDGAFSEIFDIVHHCRETGDVKECNDLLIWIGQPGVASGLHTEVLLTCIRLTVTMREHLPAWTYALKAIKKEFIKRDEDTDALLHGLG